MKLLAITVAALLAAGCATPTVIETRKVGDDGLTCAQIKAEFDAAEQAEKEARGERKVTGTNVAAALFFLPGLVATYLNTDEAIDAAKERKANLLKLAEQKRCKI